MFNRKGQPMTHMYLNVPYEEWEEVQKLGARWDTVCQRWHVPAGVSAASFARWTPKAPVITLRAPRYWLAQSHERCWLCHHTTDVYAVLLPPGHEALSKDGRWAQHDHAVLLIYLTDVSPDVRNTLHGITRIYRPDYSRVTRASYWLNHCLHCSMRQGEHTLHGQPGDVFLPDTEALAARISLTAVGKPFEGDACTSRSEMLESVLF